MARKVCEPLQCVRHEGVSDGFSSSEFGTAVETGIYQGYLSDGCCILLFSAGPYDLYKVRDKGTD